MQWLLSRVILRRPIFSIVAVVLAWSFLDSHLVSRRLRRAAQDRQAQASLSRPARIYIASLHWNSEKILRDTWNSALAALVKELGPNNVHVSIVESGSWDDSKGALRDLAQELEAIGVPKDITLDERTHAVEIASPPAEPAPGWIRTSRGKIELRRIPYLARLRNRSLHPLLELEKNGTTFDYVLFLNDIHFTVSEVLALINTNSGNYSAACSFDFSHPPKYYDTFALRDTDGHGHASYTWPYFRSTASRKAMKLSKPAPVLSCWNGMVVMPAAAFQANRSLSFRGIDDRLAEQHLEGSECCLIHADNTESSVHGVYLNPNVRVGYNGPAYQAVNPPGVWLSYWEIWFGLWKNRVYRWFTTPLTKEWVCRSRQRAWENANYGLHERGSVCLINEMQVIVANGWVHV